MVFFLIDVEITGSKRNWDRAIEYAVLAYDSDGNKLGQFVRRVNNGQVRIKPAAYAVHGISSYDHSAGAFMHTHSSHPDGTDGTRTPGIGLT